MTTTLKRWTVNTIKEHMRAAGSHWFDPDTMRFFGTRVEPTVYQGRGGVYFVTSEQPPHGKRAWTVRQFDPTTDDISTIGELAVLSQKEAIEQAKNLAASERGEFETVNEEYKPVTTLDQFVLDLDRHSANPSKVTMTDAKRLITHAKGHHRLMEQLCSDEDFCREVDADGNHPHITANRAKCRQAAKRLGASGVIFSGDPRGCTVKLTFADGFTNDFAREGYCVPIEV
jgi:hypothetical protein